MTQQRRKGREKDRKRGRRRTGSTETNDGEKSRNSRKRKQMLRHLTSRFPKTTREEMEWQAINRDTAKLAEAVWAAQGMMLGCRIMREKMSQKGWPYTEEERNDKGGKSPQGRRSKGKPFSCRRCLLDLSRCSEHVRKYECLSETFEELVSHRFHHTILQGWQLLLYYLFPINFHAIRFILISEWSQSFIDDLHCREV